MDDEFEQAHPVRLVRSMMFRAAFLARSRRLQMCVMTDPARSISYKAALAGGIGCHSINYIDASSYRCSAAQRLGRSRRARSRASVS
jgi:hypothetical protein